MSHTAFIKNFAVVAFIALLISQNSIAQKPRYFIPEITIFQNLNKSDIIEQWGTSKLKLPSTTGFRLD